MLFNLNPPPHSLYLFLCARLDTTLYDTVLFNDALLHNVRYGRPDASVEEVAKAARDAR